MYLPLRPMKPLTAGSFSQFALTGLLNQTGLNSQRLHAHTPKREPNFPAI